MKKALVVYFSASGVTEQVAEKLASAAHADCFRIQPKIAYTKADLDWTNKSSRSSVEMSDPASARDRERKTRCFVLWHHIHRLPHLVVCGSDNNQYIPREF